MATLSGPVLGPPSEVKGTEHGDRDTETSKHQLDCAKRESRKRCAGEVAEKINDENLPEANDSDDHASMSVRIFPRTLQEIVTYARPRAKQDRTANFSVFRICNFQTHLIGRMKM